MNSIEEYGITIVFSFGIGQVFVNLTRMEMLGKWENH
jgi:hypothetical protein